MSQIDETTVDVEDVIRRIQAVRRGELPESAVTVEELRAALAAQRKRFAGGAVQPAADGTSPPPERKRVSAKKKLIVDLGGLL